MLIMTRTVQKWNREEKDRAKLEEWEFNSKRTSASI